MPRIGKCSCTKHEEFASDNLHSNVWRISSNKYPRRVVDSLIKEKCLTTKSVYLCNACASFATENLLKDIVDPLSQTVNSIVDHISNGDLSEQSLIRLIKAIGGRVHSDLKTSIRAQRDQYKNPSDLAGFPDWLHEQNPVLVEFLKSVVGGELSKKQFTYLCRCLEQLYAAHTTNYIGPLTFSINLLCYLLTGSKSAHAFHHATSPSGSYPTLKDWLAGQADQPIVTSPNGDVVVFFDNNQVIERNWRVTLSYKTRVSVITNILCIREPTSNIQCVVNLSPTVWLNQVHTSDPNIFQKFHETCEQITSNVVDDFVEVYIGDIKGTLELSGDTLVDNVDKSVTDEVCTSFKDSNDPYTFVSSQHAPTQASVTLADPVLVNPSGYNNVRSVLDSLNNQFVVDTPRKWIVVGCDGSPYNIVQKIIESDFTCSHCNVVCTKGKKDFQEHLNSCHPEVSEVSISECQKFGNFIVLPGAGHIEMNLIKCLFKVLWKPYLRHVAILCGFRSPQALKYAESCSNHHKSWMIFLIFLNATLSELVKLYLQSQPTLTSATHFRQWVLADTQPPNMRFLGTVLFQWVLPVYVFRAGVRRNNPRIMLAAREIASSIFYGTGASTYQELIFRDTKWRLLAPDSVLQFINHHEIVSVSGHPSRGEGGDFILEARNRRVKMCIPPGIPTESSWIRSCRNLDQIEEVQNAMTSRLGLMSSPFFSTITSRSLSREITAFRSWIRQSGHLGFGHTHTGLDSADIMDPQLISCVNQCVENQERYRDKAVQGKFVRQIGFLSRIYVTPNDRELNERPEKKTVAQLISIINEKLHDLNADDDTRQKWAQAKKGNKPDILAFYEELLDREITHSSQSDALELTEAPVNEAI